MVQFSEVFIPNCQDKDCKGALVMRQWNVDRPRLLHASAHTVFLVGAVYVCEYGHQILSTDPRILMLIPDHLIPFVLLHCTGFLKDFLQTVILRYIGISSRPGSCHLLHATCAVSGKLRTIQASRTRVESN